MITGELADLVRPVEVLRTLPLEQIPPDLRPLLSLADGAPWVVAQAPGSLEDSNGGGEAPLGLIVYVASAPTLSWTNLPAMPLMVPLMQELVRQGVGGGIGAAAVAGASPVAPTRSVELRPVRAGASGPRPLDRDGRTTSPIREAGLYTAYDQGGEARGVIAVNPDTDAGRTDAQPRAAVEAWFAAAGAPASQLRWRARAGAPESASSETSLAEADRDAGISFPMLLAGLALALAELVMARAFSHARSNAPPVSAMDADALEEPS